jgi:hypothetical protein
MEVDMLPSVRGRHQFALVLLRFKDIPVLSNPISEFQELVSEMGQGKGGLFDFWKEVTYDQVDLTGSKVFGWWTMQYSFAEVYDPTKVTPLTRFTWVAEARRLAGEHGIDLAPFHGVIAVINGMADGSSAGLGGDYAMPSMGAWGQAGWRWCSKCQTLASGAHALPGKCPAGGVHDHTGSGQYLMAHNLPTFPGQQGWRWCKKCEGLFLAGAGSASVCPVSGAHDGSASGAYTLPHGEAPFPGQPDWRWCKKCGVLAFSKPQAGPCAAGGTHDHSASGKYTMIQHETSLTMYFAAHEMGHAFRLPHSRSQAGVEYGDPLDLMSGPHGGHNTSTWPSAGPGLNAPTLHRSGWMASNRVFTVGLSQSGSFSITLVALNQPGSQGYLLGRVITPDRVYTAELRHPNGWDQGSGTARVYIHELRSLFTASQNGWRYCKKCAQLNFAGAHVCPAGGCHDLSASGDYALCFTGPGSSGQAQWRYCRKCHGLSFGGGSTTGKCPAAGGHDYSASGDYTLAHNDPSAPGQNGWRWCNKCEGLFFAGDNLVRVCPVGGLHDATGSGAYTLLPHNFAPAGAQPGWRYCRKCTGLFFAGDAPCSAGAYHDNSASADYGLMSDTPAALGQVPWKWCRKCQGLAFAGHGTPGECPAGGTHDHGASGIYRVPSEETGLGGQGGWRWCKKCEGMIFSGAPATLCSAGGTHDLTASGKYVIASAETDHTYSIQTSWNEGQTFQDQARGLTISIVDILPGGTQAKVTISRS